MMGRRWRRKRGRERGEGKKMVKRRTTRKRGTEVKGKFRKGKKRNK